MNALLKRYGHEKRWVKWQLETVKGKPTKVPYQASGKLASTTDGDTWATYETIKGEREGIVLTDGKLLCIDIDHVLVDGKLDHEQKELIADLILDTDTYTEVSQSGTGLHLFLELTSPLDLSAHKKAPFEAYTSGRYICVTGKDYGEPRELRLITPEEAHILVHALIPQKKVEDDFLPPAAPQPTHLDDEELLQRMFTSRNGGKIEKLYNGSLAGHKNDTSTGDMALCSHLAFWTGKDAEQIERLWLASPLGAREKTQTRKDYRSKTIEAAIAKCKEIYTAPPAQELDLLHFKKDDKIVYYKNTENIYRILKMHPEWNGRFRYDVFKNTLEIKDHELWREQEDADAIMIQTRISVLYPAFNAITKTMVWDAMTKITKENTFDSAVDYLKRLVWDNRPRIDLWLPLTYGVADDVYHRAVGANWLKALVKRIMVPGCKFDHVLVLEGPQGAKKSSSLAILGGEWHVETTASTDNKDFFMLFAGKAIIEFSEGETLSRTEVARMKGIISTTVDRYRMPYERNTRDFPRRSVFAMTTNKEEYLKDDTGNRRWLPVRLVFPKADLAWLASNRDQLLAEAYHRVMVQKETIYEFPEEETLAEQNARMMHDANEDAIAEWYMNELRHKDRAAGITIDQVYTQCLNKGFASKPLDRSTETQIGHVLIRVLGLKKRKVMQGNARIARYFTDKVYTAAEISLIEQSEQQRIF